MADTIPSTCPRCASPMSATDAAGLCPRCLLAMNFQTRTMPTGGDAASSPPPTPADLAEKFPQFEILECLGRGGMGIVYKARQKALDRIVAIKILAGEWQDAPGFAERFEKEAKLLAKLNHPNIVTIHDFGNAGGLFHIVMEFIDGVNVRDLLRDGKMPAEQALAIVPPICDALQFAHDHGIVHRDIKPENILLDREGRVKIADFGIATLAGDATDRSGTPAYMAPEQEGHAGRIDHRADIFALGVVLYEMLTGERPTTSPVPPSKRVMIDVRLDEVVLRALENTPELRFQQASEVRTRVETILDRKPAALLKTQEGRLSLQPDGGQRMRSPVKGSLSLHSDRLLISSKDGLHEIPLEAIRAIGTAVMPAWFSMGGHCYLSVDFEEAGKLGRLVFLPIEGNFGLPATTVRRVQDWLHSIGQAVHSAKGRSLPEPSPAPSIIPVKSAVALWWSLLAALAVVGFVMFGMITARSLPGTPAEPFWLGALQATARMAMWSLPIVAPGLVVVLTLRRKPASPREGDDLRSYLAAGIFLLGLMVTPLLLSFTQHQGAALGFGGACMLASSALGIASWRTPLGRFMTFVGVSGIAALIVMLLTMVFPTRSVAESSRLEEARKLAEPAAAKPIPRVYILLHRDGRAKVNGEKVEDMEAVLMRIAGIDRATLVTFHTVPETPAGILETTLQKCVRAGLTNIKVMSPDSPERR